MPSTSSLAGWFDAERPRLVAMAQRMLGSTAEAEDAVQDAWLRLERSDSAGINDFGAWLTTVVSRLAIDRLRVRTNSREDDADVGVAESRADTDGPLDPEQELLLADSVGIALLVVLDRLSPLERVAFVLHDLFAMPFNGVAEALGCSPQAARQLASRARRAIRGLPENESSSRDTRKRALVEAFYVAARSGDLAGLLHVLDADVVLRINSSLTDRKPPQLIKDAQIVAKRSVLGAAQQSAARIMLVNGRPGIVVAPAGRPQLVMTFEFSEYAISTIEIIVDPRKLELAELAIMDD